LISVSCIGVRRSIEILSSRFGSAERPESSRTRIVGMYTLRGYLVLAVVMLIVKAVEVSIGG
jgi:hypothetical protein